MDAASKHPPSLRKVLFTIAPPRLGQVHRARKRGLIYFPAAIRPLKRARFALLFIYRQKRRNKLVTNLTTFGQRQGLHIRDFGDSRNVITHGRVITTTTSSMLTVFGSATE